MSDFCGIVKKEQGYLDVLNGEEQKIYKYKGETYIVAYDGEIYNKEEMRENSTTRHW